jgi:FtsZ-binding cell division protein ZapB
VSDIEHELIATLWDLKVAKDRIDKLTKSNLQLRQGAEEQKQRINQLEQENDALRADLLLWREQEAKP